MRGFLEERAHLDPRTSARFETLRWLVGDTPLLALHVRVRGRELTVYAKNEIPSFTGSIKDRMALHMLDDAYLSGTIKPGDRIAEATSGNTGISFAAIGRALGHPVRIYMPDWMSRERVLLIQGYGAEVVPVSKQEGGFLGSIAMADAYAAETPGVFRPQQFSSVANVAAHYHSTGPELIAQLGRLRKRPTAFVAGVGTGGTVMGVGLCLRETFGDDVGVHPLEPANSPTLRTGSKVGSHRIQGISDEFIPDIVQLERLSPIVDVWDGDAILMSQRLARELGLAVGISSGANMLGAIQVALEQGPKAVVATVFPDSNKKYLSTDLCGAERVDDGYLSPDVECLGFDIVPRLGTGYAGLGRGV
ncbi:MAG: PLP-dependent cysteine synthase family protein [Planctomycetes bacterium]|nr:PLP-dependent cysteine synthase family protein [Planctomycetota bacterium]